MRIHLVKIPEEYSCSLEGVHYSQAQIQRRLLGRHRTLEPLYPTYRKPGRQETEMCDWVSPPAEEIRQKNRDSGSCQVFTDRVSSICNCER